MKTVTVRLDRFGQDALMHYMAGAGGSRTLALRSALRYFLDEPDEGRIARRVPHTARQVDTDEGLEIDVDDELYAELEHEARRQEVTPDLLATHAVMYFMAELDSGRAAARLGDAMNRDAEAD
jgi:hypothetical protein